MRNIDIAGIGVALPREVSNNELEKKFNLSSIEKVTKLKSRHFFDDVKDIDEYILKAVDEALKNANITKDKIACIISSGAVNKMAIPYNASNIHRLLKLSSNVGSFDVNMTCLSFLRAFDIASRMIEEFEYILFVSVDVASVGLDWENLGTAGLFGDGISAVIFKKSSSGGLIKSNFYTCSSGYEICTLKSGGYLYNPRDYKDQSKLGQFCMNGKELFRLVMNEMPAFLADCNINYDEISYIIPHQASFSSLKNAIKYLKLPSEKIINIFENHGNQIASSLPIALNFVIKTKDLKSGEKLLFLGTGAGVSLGCVLWQKP
ncbi:hypothetical protein AVANS14531_03300 [Campylobacter sp. Cr9]|uniref:3-oxoacyl-[acyl-carrier-protein] synthase III C-terminal domain-containing protein n=1 Tax=Campylobacter sp. Cr9 TaxID=2735728 RepID=UPI003014A848|nr:hypothetical protein [Campylobacter sp. Cr9]